MLKQIIVELSVYVANLFVAFNLFPSVSQPAYAYVRRRQNFTPRI